MSKKLKELILGKRKEGMVVFTTNVGYGSADIKEFIQQPADGILYDLNRLEEISLTFLDDPKWVNDFAVALTIRELKSRVVKLETALEKIKEYATGASIGIDLEGEGFKGEGTLAFMIEETAIQALEDD